MPNCDKSLERRVVTGTLPEFKWKAIKKRVLEGESFEDLADEYGFPADFLRMGISNRMAEDAYNGKGLSDYFIYVVTADEFKAHGLFKIGMSWSVERRLVAMQTGCPYTLYAHRKYRVEGPVIVEKGLHAMFSDKRVKGEWFSLTDSDIGKIDEAMSHPALNGDESVFDMMFAKI